MAIIRNLLVRAGADFSELQKEMQNAQKFMKSAGKEITSIGKTLTLGITTTLLGLGTAAVSVSANFQESISKVAAISGATGDDLERLTEKAKEMGATTKYSASESAEAFQYMAMAGWKTEDMLDGISGIMNLAAASGEELATVSDICTDALTAFGMSASDSGRFADILASASSNANTNVSMLGESFKYVAPLCGSMGYSAEDTSIALSLMANAGIKGSQSGTSLKTALTNMLSPTSSMASVMEEYSLSLTNADGSMKSLKEVMDMLREKMGGLDEVTQGAAASTLFGKEALAGMLSIINASDSDYDKLTQAIYNCDGTAKTMADTMQDNLNGKLTQLKSALEGVAISFGEVLIPMLMKAVEKITNVVQKFANLDEETRKLILIIGAIAASIGPLLLVIGKLITTGSKIAGWGKGVAAAMKGVMAGTKGIGAVMTAVFGPGGVIIAVIAGIAALVAGFIYLWNTNEDFKNFFINTWNAIVEFMAPILEYLKTVIVQCWVDITTMLQPYIDGIKTFIVEAWNFILTTIVPILNNIWSAIVTAWQYVWDTLQPILAGLKETISVAWDFILSVISIALEKISTVVSAGFAIVKEIFTAVTTAIKFIWNNFGDLIVSKIKNVWDTVTGVVKGASQVLQGIFQTLTGLLTGNWEKCWQGISNIVSGVWQGITSFVKGGINAIISSINMFIRGINKIKVPDFVPGLGGKGFNISEIPMLAKGTDYFQGGLAIVGEQGPELVSMPRGSQVTPNKETENILSNGGTFILQTVLDGKVVAETIAPYTDIVGGNRLSLSKRGVLV
ncbi:MULTISPECIES: phage tail tape measure protein [Clostridia]|uniref:Phage tail tape measure protein n=2 Tax=Clostridia TaxID=186801 RepID=A0A8I0AA17_9CLOT|nr:MULTISPECIES: phage tail tape measure protein [Clostridia]MBC5640206.1 phage tail tape measure protein [Clostridium lentum]MBC5654424.1 phage tail tape measure protein [Blautia lenta]